MNILSDDDLNEKIELLATTIKDLQQNNEEIKIYCKEIDGECIHKLSELENNVNIELSKIEDYSKTIKEFDDRLRTLEELVTKIDSSLEIVRQNISDLYDLQEKKNGNNNLNILVIKFYLLY